MFKLLVETGVLKRIGMFPNKEARNLKDRLKILEKDPFPDGRDKKEIKGTKKMLIDSGLVIIDFSI